MTSLLWLVCVASILYLIIWTWERWNIYQRLGTEMRFGAPCLYGGDGSYGYMSPGVRLTPEARALLAQWPRKLWPIGYFLRFEGNHFVAPAFVYYGFLEEMLQQTGEDVKELNKISKDPQTNRDRWSQFCHDYSNIATFDDWRSYSPTYTVILSRDGPDPRIPLAIFLPSNFRKKLFEDRIDPFTGQPLPPPPDAPTAKSAP
ncbi:MAG: hypothetical protein HZC25_13995 [Rhodospirillales bacterium]|nr:hypothetical protein [Rhodospirillales bacterium]